MKSAQIKNIGRVVTGKTPATAHTEYYGGDILFVTPPDMISGFVIQSTERTITDEGLKSIRSNSINGRSILVSCIGDIGRVAITESTCATNQQINAITDINDDLYDAWYVYYKVSTLKNRFLSCAGCTVVPILAKSAFEEVEISDIPPLDEQKKISSVLSTIDRKIALNRKRIATLEAMAKEIYDYWFVQFDFPDANGRPYKSSGGAMVYNPDLKREIPKGWEVKPLGELTLIILGGTPATEESRYWDGGTVPWLSSGEVANFPVLTSEKKITELAIKNSATDLMPSGSVALSITRYIRPTILAIEACANQSVVGVLETEQLHNSLIYPYLVTQVPRFLGLRTGAQQPHINKDTVSGSLLPVAAPPVLKWYYDLVDPVYNDIMVVARNLQEMYKLRDFLLPLLMNGQVKVG